MRALVVTEVPAATDAFGGSEEDIRIWASIAWRVGTEAFHFALMDKLAENAADGTQNVRRRDGSHYTRRIKVARVVLSRKFPDLIKVFNLVVKNGKNRRESIVELASRRKLDRKAANDLYWGHLKKISFSFHAQ